MTQVIVDQRYDTIIVDDSPNNTILVKTPETNLIITAGEQGPPGITYINQASDVNVSNLENGSILVYSESSEKWVATRLLENQSVESGHY